MISVNDRVTPFPQGGVILISNTTVFGTSPNQLHNRSVSQMPSETPPGLDFFFNTWKPSRLVVDPDAYLDGADNLPSFYEQSLRDSLRLKRVERDSGLPDRLLAAVDRMVSSHMDVLPLHGPVFDEATFLNMYWGVSGPMYSDNGVVQHYSHIAFVATIIASTLVAHPTASDWRSAIKLYLLISRHAMSHMIVKTSSHLADMIPKSAFVSEAAEVFLKSNEPIATIAFHGLFGGPDVMYSIDRFVSEQGAFQPPASSDQAEKTNSASTGKDRYLPSTRGRLDDALATVTSQERLDSVEDPSEKGVQSTALHHAKHRTSVDTAMLQVPSFLPASSKYH